MRVAGIDVGTNSLLLLIAEADGAALRPVLDRSDITRLGEGVDRTGLLAPEAAARTLDVLAEYARACADGAVAGIAAAGTSALRDARNRDDFLARAGSLGILIEVITGEREAELTYADVAATHAPPGEPLSLLDIGGGSTELVTGTGGQVQRRLSLEIGSNRLTERVRLSDPPTAAGLHDLRRTAAASLPLPAIDGRLVGSGGTITTLAAVVLGRERYDAEAVGRVVLSLATATELVERLAGLTLAERERLPGLEPKRAPVIVAGAVLVELCLHRLGRDELAVSTGGLRYALARLAAQRVAAGG